MNGCWCCGRTDRKLERHHLLARRYLHGDRDHRHGNIVRICRPCHRSIHAEHDNPRWSQLEYVIHMESIDYGRGLYLEKAA